MITHVIVELKYPVEDEYFHMDTVFPNEYYGYGTPLIRCKDCKYFTRDSITGVTIPGTEYCIFTMNNRIEENDYCSRAERKEE